MKLFFRYFISELLKNTFLFFVSILFLLTLIKGTLFIRQILDLEIGGYLLIKFYFLNSLQLISFVLPLSALLGVLFSIQRMKEEKEFLALFSLGYNLKDLFKAFLVFLFLTFLVTFLSQFFLLPKSKRIQKEILIALNEQTYRKAIPIKTPTSITNNLYLYAGNSYLIDSVNHLGKIIIFEKKSPNVKGIYLGEEGYLNTKEGILNLKKGWIFYLEQNKNIEILEFRDYNLKIGGNLTKKEEFFLKRGELNFRELKNQLESLPPKSEKYYRYLSEYYQRIFYAFLLIPLLLQGFILSLFLKSQSKLFLFFIGITNYVILYLSYNFVISLIEMGKISPKIVHLLFFTLFGLLIGFTYKILIRKKGITF
ncbi:MAG: LptF/LptG family permease [Caldimicrobium sp.]